MSPLCPSAGDRLKLISWMHALLPARFVSMRSGHCSRGCHAFVVVREAEGFELLGRLPAYGSGRMPPRPAGRDPFAAECGVGLRDIVVAEFNAATGAYFKACTSMIVIGHDAGTTADWTFRCSCLRAHESSRRLGLAELACHHGCGRGDWRCLAPSIQGQSGCGPRWTSHRGGFARVGDGSEGRNLRCRKPLLPRTRCGRCVSNSR